MARRYRGAHSPGGPKGLTTPRPGGATRFGARVNLLFVLPFFIGIPGFWQDPAGLLQHLAAFAVLMGAAWMTREGVRAEDAYHARPTARRPALPRKLLGSLLMGAGLALAGGPPTGSVAAAVIFGLLGTVLHALSFGADPMRDKVAEDGDLYQTDRVARVVDRAEETLAEMIGHIRPLGDRRLTERVERFAATARVMCRRVEEDPRDLLQTRRYLGTYLTGARDASRKFAELYARTRDESARTEYETLLNDLEERFQARSERMLLDDKTNLEVEIEVLRDRLAREGVARSEGKDEA